MPSLLTALVLLFLSTLPLCAQKVIPLWKEGAPGPRHAHAEVSEDKRETGRSDRYLSYVSEPTLTFYPAPADKATGTTIMVVPGGGYRYVCVDKEGVEPAQWLNSLGIHVAVLKYRSLDPTVDRNSKTIPTYFGDIGRGMRVLRSEAAELGIDPNRIGVMGFSAGAVMTLDLLAKADLGDAKATDSIGHASSLPSFVIFVYGAMPPGKPLPPKGTPPFYIVHAADDPKAPVSGAKKVFKYLRDAGVPAELKIYETGGHGFGVYPAAGSVVEWPAQCVTWLRSIGML